MPIVVTIQTNLVWINYFIIIFCSNYLHRTRVPLCLFLLHIFGYHLIFQTVFQCCRACYPRTEFKYITVVSFEFVCISRHIRTRADKGHVPNKYIPQSWQLIQFIVTQCCSEWSDSGVSGNRHSRTIVVDGHCAEFMAIKEFTIFTDTFLNKKCWSSRHLDFYHDGHND